MILDIQKMMEIDSDPKKVWCTKPGCKEIITFENPVTEKIFAKC